MKYLGGKEDLIARHFAVLDIMYPAPSNIFPNHVVFNFFSGENHMHSLSLQNHLPYKRTSDFLSHHFKLLEKVIQSYQEFYSQMKRLIFFTANDRPSKTAICC